MASIVRFVFYRDKQLALAAAQTVHDLLIKATPAQLIEIDERMRYYSCCDAFPLNMRPDAASKIDLPQSLRHAVYFVSSMHSNGYVREEAVRQISAIHSGEELPYLLLRANDWVAQVRERAQVAVAARLNSSYVRLFTQWMPLVAWLQCSERGRHSAMLQRVLCWLKGLEGSDALRGGLSSPDNRTRRMAHEWALESDVISTREVIESARRRPDLATMLSLLRHAPSALSVDELQELLADLICDPLAKVRCMALSSMIETSPQNVRQFIEPALLDKAASVRNVARHAWRQTGHDPADFYRKSLVTAQSNFLAATILGLGETGAREDAARLVVHAREGIVRVRRAAISAIARLDGDEHMQLLMAAFEDAHPGVSKAGREALAKRAPSFAEHLEQLFKNSAHSHIRNNALILLSRLSGWDGLPCLILAHVDQDERIRKRASVLVNRRLIRMGRSFFVEPTSRQCDAVLQAIRKVDGNLSEGARKELLFILRQHGASEG